MSQKNKFKALEAVPPNFSFVSAESREGIDRVKVLLKNGKREQVNQEIKEASDGY